MITLINVIILSLCSLSLHAASVDGVIDPTGGEYQYSTEGSAKWNTFDGTREYDDASGGEGWDIGYMGVGVTNGEFQFGAVGGHILSGRDAGSYTLSDIAISVGSLPTLPEMRQGLNMHLGC